MTPSPAILTAIDAAVKAQGNGPVPPETIRQTYIESATDALEAGTSEDRIIAEFNQIAEQQ